MADPSQGVPVKGGSGGGVLTYRWAVMISLGIIGVLLIRVLDKIDKTADLADSLRGVVATLNSRLDAHADRLAGHDRRFERIEDRVFRPIGSPPQ